MMSRRFLTLSVVLTLPLLAAAPRKAQAQAHNYIALGDSYAFGYTTPATPASIGDQGYVSLFANSLAAQYGGIRPAVTNLAIPGETSASFILGAPSVYSNQFPYPDGLIDAPAREQSLNDNYPDLTFPQFSALGAPLPGNSQNTALLNKIAQIKANGGTVDDITLQLGGNDILALLGQSAFTSVSAAQQGLILQSAFANLQTQYTDVLAELTNPITGTPNAQIFLIGYADPFAGLGASNPLAGPDPANPVSTQLTLETNALLKGIANSFGMHYVDIYTPFLGHETQYTYITDPNLLPGGSPNYHPNATGYAVIAAAITASASTPEPSSLAFLLPVLGFAILLRRLRSRKFYDIVTLT